MAEHIVWETSFRKALDLAKKTNRLVLASFFDSCCEACMRMKGSTLVTECVQEYIRKYFISIKYESGEDSDQFMRFEVTAKPATIIFDAEGYFEPEVFIHKLELAIKKAAHRADRIRPHLCQQ
jgi:thioredoxin-related protein